MAEINTETNNSSDNLTTSIIGSIKRTIAREYEREMAEKLFAGKGFFLELEQLAEVRENLAKVTAMVRLVAKGAKEEGDDAEFVRYVSAAMSLALQELVQVDEMITENDPSGGCLNLDSTDHESGI
jgi:hypothetical protein